MERGNKKVLKEPSLPLGPVTLEVLPKEQTSIESKYLSKATGETQGPQAISL